MSTSDYPWEPPLAGSEVEHLIGALDRLRTTFRWKADDLDAAGLGTSIGASSLTLGGLLKHLAAAEDYMFTSKLSGEPIGAPWDAMGWDGTDDWEFTFAANDPPDQLYALWDGAVERSRARLDAALAEGGPDQLVHVSWPDGRHASLRRLVGADLRDPAEIERLVTEAGEVDVLVNNAGHSMWGPTEKTTVEDFDAMFASNVRSAYLLVGAFAPAMADTGTGSIVNTSSIAGRIGLPDGAAYGATKAALASLTQSWTSEYSP